MPFFGAKSHVGIRLCQRIVWNAGIFKSHADGIWRQALHRNAGLPFAVFVRVVHNVGIQFVNRDVYLSKFLHRTRKLFKLALHKGRHLRNAVARRGNCNFRHILSIIQQESVICKFFRSAKVKVNFAKNVFKRLVNFHLLQKLFAVAPRAVWVAQGGRGLVVGHSYV